MDNIRLGKKMIAGAVGRVNNGLGGAVADDLGRGALGDGVCVDEDLFDGGVRGDVEHEVAEDGLGDHPEGAGAGAGILGFLGHGDEGFLSKI